MASDELSLKYLLGTDYHPLQPELILAPEFEIAAVGGMGAGKTYAACIAAFRHAVKWPGARVLIARFTYDEMVKSTKWLFFEIMKNKKLTRYFDRPKTWDYREGTHYCRLTNGSEILFSNLDRSLDKHKNVEYSLVFIDQLEEVEFETYQLLMLRCRLTVCPSNERHMIGVANDEGDNWIRHRFLTFEPPHGLPEPRLGRRLIRGTTLQNPHLDEATKISYLSLPPEVQRRWVYATMEAGSTRLLPPFTVVESFEIPRHWPRWLGVDPARSDGVTCGEWLTANPDKIGYRGVEPNALHFYQEYWGESRDVEDHAAEMIRMTGPHNLRAHIMDQSAWASTVRTRMTKGSLSVAQLYLKAGLPVSPSTGDEWTRVMLFIEGSKRGLTVAQDACPRLIEQGPRYRVKGQLGVSGKPIIVAKSRFHAIDAGGYALSLVPTRVAYVEIRPVRDSISMPDTLDDASRQHWTAWNTQFPKMRGRDSIVTQGFDEDEFNREDDNTDPFNTGRATEETLW